MRFLQVLVFLALVVVANGGKVEWNSDGKPKVQESKNPLKGCSQGGLSTLGADNNSSSDCKK